MVVLPPTGTTVQKGTDVGVAAPRLPDYGLISLTAVDQNVPQVGAVQLHLSVRPGRRRCPSRTTLPDSCPPCATPLPGRCAGRTFRFLLETPQKSTSRKRILAPQLWADALQLPVRQCPARLTPPVPASPARPGRRRRSPPGRRFLLLCPSCAAPLPGRHAGRRNVPVLRP